MKLIYLSRISRRVSVPDHVWDILHVYKVFFPPETTVKLGPGKITTIGEIEVFPPPEQQPLLDMAPEKPKRKSEFN